jgi:hypothetical protein
MEEHQQCTTHIATGEIAPEAGLCLATSNYAVFKAECGRRHTFWNGSFHLEVPFVSGGIEGMTSAGFRISNDEQSRSLAVQKGLCRRSVFNTPF